MMPNLRPKKEENAMNCIKCGKMTEFEKPRSYGSNVGIVLDASRTHADYEKYAYYCKECDKVYCGECCYPKWQELKKKECLNGRELAAKLERDPGACFWELATCSVCGREADSEYSRPSVLAHFLKRFGDNLESWR
jgi:hypothetical protein